MAVIGFIFAMLGTLAVVDLILHVWDGAGGVAGARARDAERRRQRALSARVGPQRMRRHG